MYYATVVQPTPTGTWPINTYPNYTQQAAQATRALYYQVPTVIVPPLSADVPSDITTQTQQSIPTVYYQTPSIPVFSAPITTFSPQNVQLHEQPQTTLVTTTKTKVLDATTLSIADSIDTYEETSRTTVTNPVKLEIPTTDAVDISTNTNIPQVTAITNTTQTPAAETTIISERVRHRARRPSTLSTSTQSDSTMTSSSSIRNPTPETIKKPLPLLLPPPQQQSQIPIPILPPPMPNIAPVRRVIHHRHQPARVSSDYYLSDADSPKRKVYKTDYKYRHYYCCNWCRGRWDLHSRSYSCCEWFYGCPLWALIFCGLFFLALLVTFLTLFGLQPSINSTRRAETVQTRLLNRTQIIYGFYKNCGYQINATSGTPTTLILCTNTATTTTARVELSPFYTVISGTHEIFNDTTFVFVLLCVLFVHVHA